MDESNGPAARQAPPLPPVWKGAASLALVHRLNERCVELLQRAASDSGAESLQLLVEHRELWIGLDAAARQRIAKLPFTIVDAGFTNDTWWRAARDSTQPDVRLSEAAGRMPHDVNEILVHELILFAWQVAATDRAVAQLSFGMTASVAQIVATLSSQQVRAITMHAGVRVQLRWADDGVLWREMLTAAAANNGSRLAEIQLHTQVRFCSELLA